MRLSKGRCWRGAILAIAMGTVVAGLEGAAKPPPWLSGVIWPKPKAIDPGSATTPPSDAIVLFDGKDLSQWTGVEKWTIQDGYGIIGSEIATKRPFGDCQLHLEWASPPDGKGDGQNRGNSGVYLMGIYELQILDSYNNETYFDGEAAAVYKQRPPLVNASRKPGEWQTFEIVFRAPRFDAQGKLLRPAYITVFHNGVLVQDHFEILGESAYRKPPLYHAHAAKLPLKIQFHHCPVRYRNIWIRELEDDHEELLTPLREKLKSTASKS